MYFIETCMIYFQHSSAKPALWGNRNMNDFGEVENLGDSSFSSEFRMGTFDLGSSQFHDFDYILKRIVFI